MQLHFEDVDILASIIVKGSQHNLLFQKGCGQKNITFFFIKEVIIFSCKKF